MSVFYLYWNFYLRLSFIDFTYYHENAY